MLAAGREPIKPHIGDREGLDPHEHTAGIVGGPFASSVCAAPIRPERNGRTRLPSLDVPSANSTTGSPSASRAAISALAAAVVPALAVDEHGALQPGEQAEQRPARDFALGDEHDGRERGEHVDVEPGHVIGDDQQRRRRRRSPATRTRTPRSAHTMR